MPPSPHSFLRINKIRAPVAAYILYNALSFATLLLEVPLVRLFERSICNRHFLYNSSLHGNEIDETRCKIKTVQDQLSRIVGLHFSFNAIPGNSLSVTTLETVKILKIVTGLLLALFYGKLAERYGRRLVLFLSAVGIVGMWIWIVLTSYLRRALLRFFGL